MGLTALESSFNSSRALIQAASVMPEKAKAKSPFEFNVGGPFGDDGYAGDKHHDQYEHYRGRFYSAVQPIVKRLASQPLLVGRRGVTRKSRSAEAMMSKGYIPPNGVPGWLGSPDEIEILAVHPLKAAFEDPNEKHTPYNFWEMAGASVMVTGRSFIVAMPAKGRPFDLFPIPSTWMSPTKNGDGWNMKPPRSTEKPLKLSSEQVSYSYFSDPSNPAAAISPLTMMGRSVLSDEAISTAQYSEFKNEGMPKVALIAGDVMNETGFTDDPNRTSAARPVRLEPHQRRQIISWYQQQYAGANKRGLPIVLDAIIRDIKQISRTPAEMAYLESASLTKEQIFEGVSLSPILTGQLGGVTRASGALAEQFFMDYCFNPMLTMFSQSITKKLCPLFSEGNESGLVAWISPGLPRDTELDIEYLRLGIRSYALQRNDVRRVLATRFGGLPQIEGFDDVIIPEKLEERLPEEDYLGVGRLSAEEPKTQDNE